MWCVLEVFAFFLSPFDGDLLLVRRLCCRCGCSYMHMAFLHRSCGFCLCRCRQNVNDGRHRHHCVDDGRNNSQQEEENEEDRPVAWFALLCLEDHHRSADRDEDGDDQDNNSSFRHIYSAERYASRGGWGNARERAKKFFHFHRTASSPATKFITIILNPHPHPHCLTRHPSVHRQPQPTAQTPTLTIDCRDSSKLRAVSFT